VLRCGEHIKSWPNRVSLHVYPPTRKPRIGPGCARVLAGAGRLCDVRQEVAI
jgi:hypothetical protein